MGNTCCNFTSKDPNTLSVGTTNDPLKVKTKITNLTPEQKETFHLAQQNVKSVIKIQANVRGMLARKQATQKRSFKK